MFGIDVSKVTSNKKNLIEQKEGFINDDFVYNRFRIKRTYHVPKQYTSCIQEVMLDVLENPK